MSRPELFVQYGEYGTRNGDTFERLIPAGGTGPTLILPVALALQLSGSSLVAARLVIVAFLLIAIVGVYLLVRQIAGWPAASIGVLLFLSAGDPTYDMLWASRQVLAEAPSFAFLMFGLWAWVNDWHGNRAWLIASGLLVALAIVTKNRLLWIIGPSIVLIFVADRLYYHQLGWRHGLIPILGAILGYGGWYVVSLWIVGPAAQTTYLEALGALAAATYLHGDPGRWFNNAKVLIKNPQSWAAIIALIYNLTRARDRSSAGLARLMLPVFAGVGLASFVVLAIPFPRYLLAPLGFALLCCAVLIDDVACWVAKRRRSEALWRVVVAAFLVAILAGPRIVQNTQRILATNDTSAQQFATQLDQMVPAGAEVLNWEWEIEFYSHAKYVHPPFRLFPALLDALDHRYDAILDQPRIPAGVQYLVLGPFGHWVFDEALAMRNQRVLITEGAYSLHQLY